MNTHVKMIINSRLNNEQIRQRAKKHAYTVEWFFFLDPMFRVYETLFVPIILLNR